MARSRGAIRSHRRSIGHVRAWPARSVRATGYDGPCSVEVMDPNVLALPAEEAIRRAAETMKPLLARVER